MASQQACNKSGAGILGTSQAMFRNVASQQARLAAGGARRTAVAILLQKRVAKRSTDQARRRREKAKQTEAGGAAEVSESNVAFQLVAEDSALGDMEQGGFYNWLWPGSSVLVWFVGNQNGFAVPARFLSARCRDRRRDSTSRVHWQPRPEDHSWDVWCIESQSRPNPGLLVLGQTPRPYSQSPDSSTAGFLI